MAESFPEIGKGALEASLTYIKVPQGGKFLIHISTDNIQVAKELCKLAGYVSLGVGVATLGTLLGYQVLKPLVEDAVNKVFGRNRDDQQNPEIRPGSLRVSLHCLTDKRFLEVLEDYESGKMKESLEKEFEKVGFKVEGLNIKIENIEELNETKKAITKRNSDPSEMMTESEGKRTKKTDQAVKHWTPAQKNRLAIEKRILERFFPSRVTWIDPKDDTKVEVSLNTNNDNKYCLRIYLKSDGDTSSDFPNSVPEMVVRSSPKPMPRWDGDGDKHTLGYRDGFLKICHYRPSRWTGNSTLYEVVMKGRLWLEAYEGYLRTGKYLSTFLGEMRE